MSPRAATCRPWTTRVLSLILRRVWRGTLTASACLEVLHESVDVLDKRGPALSRLALGLRHGHEQFPPDARLTRWIIDVVAEEGEELFSTLDELEMALQNERSSFISLCCNGKGIRKQSTRLEWSQILVKLVAMEQQEVDEQSIEHIEAPCCIRRGLFNVCTCIFDCTCQAFRPVVAPRRVSIVCAQDKLPSL